jgi:hypothetical protein
VEIVVIATFWGMFACFLLFPYLGMPAYLHRAATTLMAAEFVATLVWSFSSAGCVERPCAQPAEAARTAISVDIPLLALGVIALAIIRGVRHHQRLKR